MPDNNSTLELMKRMIAVKESGVFSYSYSKEYIAAYPKSASKVDTIRNVWNCKGLITNIKMVENFETLCASLKAS